MRRRDLLALPLLALLPSRAPAQGGRTASPAHAPRVVNLMHGLQHPWGLAFLPDGGMLVTERPGRLRLIQGGRLRPEPVRGLPQIRQYGQGGLLDVALHPRFRDNGLVYLSYAGGGHEGVGTEVLRGRLLGDRLADVQVIFRMQPKLDTAFHFGARLVFDRAGHLYVTLGDRGYPERAQRLTDHAGTVVRLLDDGRVPPDNPFVGRDDAVPATATCAWGRTAWSIFTDEADGRLGPGVARHAGRSGARLVRSGDGWPYCQTRWPWTSPTAMPSDAFPATERAVSGAPESGLGAQRHLEAFALGV